MYCWDNKEAKESTAYLKNKDRVESMTGTSFPQHMFNNLETQYKLMGKYNLSHIN